MEDADFTAEWLREEGLTLLQDVNRLKTMRRQAWSYGIRNAADVMAQRILGVVSEGGDYDD